MRPLLRSFLQFFTSLRLTVVLLILSMILVFIATLDQVNLGVWAVQQKYFRSLFVMARLPGTDLAVPVFPGGYLIGGLLLLNLVAAHAYRFRLTWTKSGLWLTHFGLILLLLGELFTGLWQQESLMRLDQGATKNYSESYPADGTRGHRHHRREIRRRRGDPDGGAGKVRHHPAPEAAVHHPPRALLSQLHIW